MLGRRRPVPKMLRVISRPITVPAERIALLNAGLSIIFSNMPGSVARLAVAVPPRHLALRGHDGGGNRRRPADGCAGGASLACSLS